MNLQPLPETYAATRDALHRVAAELVAPARKPQNEIALTQTPGGFGTPRFEFDGEHTQVRVDRTDLVLDAGGEELRAPLENVATCADLLGPDLLPDGVPDDATPLAIDPVAADCLADFYALSSEVLERFREGLPGAAEASAINLWPEHFDIAFEAGAAAAGQRANYGASPGDEEHPEPYLYVGPWTAKPTGDLWDAQGFTGAELGYTELIDANDPVRVAVAFFESRFTALST